MKPLHVVVMGVSGCGKSVVGAQLAARLQLPLVEGDAFHPAANIEKMRQAIPLTDADRADWLSALAAELAARPRGAVLTCSALKRAYRMRLREGVADLHFLHLELTQAQALRRVAARADHFYPPSLVASQFEALEDPSSEARVRVADAQASVDEIVKRTVTWLGRDPAAGIGSLA